MGTLQAEIELVRGGPGVLPGVRATARRGSPAIPRFTSPC